MNSIGEPVYHIFYVYDAIVEDFIELGIYTKEDDAKEHQRMHCEATGANSGSVAAGVVTTLSHGQLCYRLAMRCLGPMAKKLRQMTETAEPEQPKDVVSLYGKGGFPVLVARRRE